MTGTTTPDPAADVVLVGFEPSSAAALVQHLRREGLVVAHPPCQPVGDAIVLIGGARGAADCAEVRAADPDRRIIVLVEHGQAVPAFEAGADDVVRRDGLSVRELVLRLRAVRRRRTATTEAPTDVAIRVGPLVLGPALGDLELEGRPVWIPPAEFRLLRVLAQRSEKVVDRRTLVDLAWGEDVDARTVDSIVKRLRIRLGPAGSLIETVRGVGYRLSARAAVEG